MSEGEQTRMEMAPFLKYLPGICFYLVLNYLPPLWDTKKSDAEKKLCTPGCRSK